MCSKRKFLTVEFQKLMQVLCAILFIAGFFAQPVRAELQSVEVAYLGSLSVQNGGAFPSTIAPFNSFSFHQVTRAGLSLAALAPGGVCGVNKCDTLLLNVASAGATGLACNVNANLTAIQKADLVSFVVGGGKLIIYDSECPTQNYGWLPFPFTTANPGALGANGTLTIVENNVLSSTVAADPKFINAGLLSTATDAIGDMNVMTTRDPNWCLDMSGTNAINVTGPVHTYARHGSGLIIYNGMDVDVLASTTAPNAASGPGNLSKVWLQELQTPFNPSPIAALPCGATVVGINLTPATATNNLTLGQTSHTLTATLKDLLNNPEVGHTMTFTVLSGPNAGAAGPCSPASCITDAAGQVTWTYFSSGVAGTDSIRVCTLDNTGAQLCSQTVTKVWVTTGGKCDVDGDGDVDRNDIAIIFAARGQRVPPGNPALDIDGDGIITVNDARGCALQCTRLSCVP